MSYLVDGVVATGAGAFHAGETPQSSPTPYQETEPDDSTQEPISSVPSSIPSTSVGSLPVLDDDVAKEIEVSYFLFHLSRNLIIFALDSCPISNGIKKTNPCRFRVASGSAIIKEAAPSSG